MIRVRLFERVRPTTTGKWFALLDARKTIPAARDQRGINRQHPSRIGDQKWLMVTDGTARFRD